MDAPTYNERSQHYRPNCEHCLRREVVLMYSRGLTERDIASALQLDPTEVRRMLIEGVGYAPPPEGTSTL